MSLNKASFLLKRNNLRKWIFIFISSMFLFGCANVTEILDSSIISDLRPVNNAYIYSYTDPVTGTQYIIYSHYSGNAGMGGITPRLNLDGSLYTGD